MKLSSAGDTRPDLTPSSQSANDRIRRKALLGAEGGASVSICIIACFVLLERNASHQSCTARDHDAREHFEPPCASAADFGSGIRRSLRSPHISLSSLPTRWTLRLKPSAVSYHEAAALQRRQS